jgi:hypothetical protein
MNSTTPLTIEHERQVVKRLLDLVADRSRREQEIESRHAAEIAEEQQQYQQVFQLLSETYEGEFASCQRNQATERASIEERWQSEASTVQVQFDQVLEDINDHWQTSRDAAQKELDESNWLFASLLDEDTEDSPRARLQALRTGMAASRTELDIAVTTLDGWYRTTTAFLQKCRILGESALPAPSALPMDLTGLHQSCVESMRQGDPVQQRILHRFLPGLFRGVWPVLIFVLVSARAVGFDLGPGPAVTDRIENHQYRARLGLDRGRGGFGHWPDLHVPAARVCRIPGDRRLRAAAATGHRRRCGQPALGRRRQARMRRAGS